MTEALMNRINAQLVRHEVLRPKPYRCIDGKLTIPIIGFQIKYGMTRVFLRKRISKELRFPHGKIWLTHYLENNYGLIEPAMRLSLVFFLDSQTNPFLL
jgi:hypothetical protein